MIKILHVLSSGLMGGTELMTLRLIRGMNPNDFTNQVAFFRGNGPVGEELAALGVPVTVLDWTPKRAWTASRRLFSLLMRERYDIVQVYGLKANILVRPMARLCGIPVVITAQRSVDLDRRPWHAWADLLTSPLVSLYLSNSQAGADFLIKRERIPRAKVRTVHNGIDLRTQAESGVRQGVRAEVGAEPGAVCVGVVARLEAVKGIDTFLQALARLRQDLPLRAVIVGEGSQRDRLITLAKDLGLLEKRVCFLGLRRDVARLLTGFDVFVLPSLWEGLPGAIMEAMCAGLPVVSTRVGGIPELVMDGQTGILVPPGDEGALAAAIKILVESPKLCRQMGDTGRTVVCSEFSIDKMVRQTEAVYRDVIRRVKEKA